MNVPSAFSPSPVSCVASQRTSMSATVSPKRLNRSMVVTAWARRVLPSMPTSASVRPLRISRRGPKPKLPDVVTARADGRGGRPHLLVFEPTGDRAADGERPLVDLAALVGALVARRHRQRRDEGEGRGVLVTAPGAGWSRGAPPPGAASAVAFGALLRRGFHATAGGGGRQALVGGQCLPEVDRDLEAAGAGDDLEQVGPRPAAAGHKCRIRGPRPSRRGRRPTSLRPAPPEHGAASSSSCD